MVLGGSKLFHPREMMYGNDALTALLFCVTDPKPPIVRVKDKVVSYYDQIIQLRCEIQAGANEVGASLKWTDPDVRQHAIICRYCVNMHHNK